MIEVYKYGGNILKSEYNRKKIYEFLKSKIKEGIKMFLVVSASIRTIRTLGNNLFTILQ